MRVKPIKRVIVVDTVDCSNDIEDFTEQQYVVVKVKETSDYSDESSEIFIRGDLLLVNKKAILKASFHDEPIMLIRSKDVIAFIQK